jgi:hypothetical protein
MWRSTSGFVTGGNGVSTERPCCFATGKLSSRGETADFGLTAIEPSEINSHDVDRILSHYLDD